MLVSLDALVRALEVDPTDQDALRRADDCWVFADAYVKGRCKWQVEAADYLEYHDGGVAQVVLDAPRVTRISGATVDDGDVDYGFWYDTTRLWGDDTLQVEDTDFRLLRRGLTGIIQRIYGCWGNAYGFGVEVVRVRYRAGYEEDEIPADIARAVVVVASQEYTAGLRTSASASSGGGTVRKVRRGQSEITYGTTTSSSSSGSAGTNTRTGGSANDPYGIDTLIAAYRDWRV